MKTLLFLLLFGSFIPTFAQEFPMRNGNILMQAALHADENKPFPLLLDADTEWLMNWCAAGNALYTGRQLNAHRIVLTSKALFNLLRQPRVRRIYWDGGQGIVLTDTSKVNARTYRIHLGDTLLPRAYTGKGVVLGFVDTGIDFLHPDFQDSNGKTRIHAIWDQRRNTDTTRRPHFGYGEVYTSTDIDAGNCLHTDPNPYSGHGTMVAGNAAGNGNSVPDSIADYSGHAPEATIVMVASNFGANWLQTVADGVAFIFQEADKLQMPAVVNLSLGSYTGSHDGLDAATLQIDSLVKARAGRAVVCAVGNAGNMPPFHLRTELKTDTAFTWFAVNPGGSAGHGVFFELWADTSEMSGLQFGIIETDTSFTDTLYPASGMGVHLDTLRTDTLSNHALYMTWAERRGGQFLLQVLILQPAPHAKYGFWSAGTGAFDVWSANWLGMSDMQFDQLPSQAQYPRMVKYHKPDTLQSMVSAWACSPNVITVGNYNNRYAYPNVENGLRYSTDLPVGRRGNTSSRGPSRSKLLKPDVAAPGNFTVTAGRMTDLNYLQTTPSVRFRLAKGGYHFGNGGSSMASPVVAGMAAMMLERCQGMNASQIAEALTSTAFPDAFTGSLPNMQYGWGKVDGLAAITRMQGGVSLMADAQGACMGDSLRLWPVGTFVKFRWSDGDTMPVYVSIRRDTVAAVVYNAQGCAFQTDTHLVLRYDLPTVNITGDSILCIGASGTLMAAGNWQKYLWNSRDSIAIYSLTDSGYYTLEVRDSNGCMGFDTIRVKVVDCTPVGHKVSNEGMNEWRVFPQPASHFLHIAVHVAEYSKNRAEVLSLQGVTQCAQNFETCSCVLDINGLPPGTYILRLQNSTGSSERLVVVY